ncbi:MAG: hypothetical protein P1U89_02100 [Verrucomicrobiales bacterium]|nr:hypothetical protein [Verrucomicrobiales bacterium]
MRILFILILIGSFPAKSIALEVLNHKNGSTVRYPLVLLRGTCFGDLSIQDGAITPVRSKDLFKALVPLKPGRNEIKMVDKMEEGIFTLTYLPQKNPYYIRVIWLTDKSGATEYATPENGEPQNYIGRLQTAAQLMQTFTAEKMSDLALGKRTFRLERDPESHDVVVHTLKGHLSADEYYKLGESGEYWNTVYQWLNREYPDPFAKNIVLAAFTRKDPATGKMKGHTALGGGNLGLFGSASVFTWPESIEKISEAFFNERIVDPARVHNDGAGRDTYWGVASTTIGATLHEMGHTFGLPHCTDRFGIMTRGFDHFHRAFTFSDPPSRRNFLRKFFTLEEEAYFAPVSATFLDWSPWFQIDRETPFKTSEEPTIVSEGNVYIFRSKSGVNWVGIWSGDNIHDYIITDQETEFRVSRSELDGRLEGKPLSRVSAIAGNGRHRVFHISEPASTQ